MGDNKFDIRIDLEDEVFLQRLEEGEVWADSRIELWVGKTPITGSEPDPDVREYIIPFLGQMLEKVRDATSNQPVTIGFRYSPGRMMLNFIDGSKVGLATKTGSRPMNPDVTREMTTTRESILSATAKASNETLQKVESVNAKILDDGEVKNINNILNDMN